jgi:sodium/bile acid cotransporter 7
VATFSKVPTPCPAASSHIHQVAWIKANINTGNVSSFCILLLVWLTFCNTFGNAAIRRTPGRDVAATVFLDAALFFAFVALCFVVAWPPPPLAAARKLLRLGRPDVVAVVICGSTKTVAMGVPLISVMYKDVPYAGLLALPLIVYHALQVLLGGLMLGPLKAWCLRGGESGGSGKHEDAAGGGGGELQLPQVAAAAAPSGSVGSSSRRSSSSWWSGLRTGKDAATAPAGSSPA